ncbi:MAG: hypothetical protein KKA90_00595 [Nanoarchaeota archaeon]|nr:hypothetical protein [Nanoarchaeota archaeon]
MDDRVQMLIDGVLKQAQEDVVNDDPHLPGHYERTLRTLVAVQGIVFKDEFATALKKSVWEHLGEERCAAMKKGIIEALLAQLPKALQNGCKLSRSGYEQALDIELARAGLPPATLEERALFLANFDEIINTARRPELDPEQLVLAVARKFAPPDVQRFSSLCDVLEEVFAGLISTMTGRNLSEE